MHGLHLLEVIFSVQALNEFHYTHTIAIGSAKLTKNRAFQPQYFYPFEFYFVMTTFVAFNTATNTTLPIIRLAFSDPVNNFQTLIDESATKTYMNNTVVKSRTTKLTLSRTVSAQIFVVLIFIANWVLTGVLVYVTSLSLWSNVKLGEGIAILPVTIILTLPQLRQFFVDAPPIGELTSISSFNTTTDTGCILGILLGMLFRHQVDHLISLFYSRCFGVISTSNPRCDMRYHPDVKWQQGGL